jgi:hypothetical protein
MAVFSRRRFFLRTWAILTLAWAAIFVAYVLATAGWPFGPDTYWIVHSGINDVEYALTGWGVFGVLLLVIAVPPLVVAGVIAGVKVIARTGHDEREAA